MSAWFWRVLVSIDQLLNVVFGPALNALLRPKKALFGAPDETLSSVLGKGMRNGDCKLCRPICWVIGWIDPNHCTNNIEEDEGIA